MLEQAIGVLDEDLLDLRLVSLHLYLHVGPIGKLSRLLVLYLKLIATTRHNQRLVHSADDLRAIERCVVEFFQALVLLYLLRAHSI